MPVRPPRPPARRARRPPRATRPEEPDDEVGVDITVLGAAAAGVMVLSVISDVAFSGFALALLSLVCGLFFLAVALLGRAGVPVVRRSGTLGVVMSVMTLNTVVHMVVSRDPWSLTFVLVSVMATAAVVPQAR